MNKNNFDFLRLLFAFFVIITHSYSLSGLKECDILCQITPNHINLSYIGVRGFFIISGYLIFQSVMRSKGLIDYYWKRLLRLIPGLFVVLLLTVLLAQFIYHGSIPYWHNRHVLMYLPNNLTLFKTQMSFEGIFETNPTPNTINGSLWTLVYEFSFYIILSLFIFTKNNKLKTTLLLLVLYLFFNITILFFSKDVSGYGIHAIDVNNFTKLGSFFIGGSILASIDIDRYGNKNKVFFVSLFLLILTVVLNKFSYFQFLLLPVVIIIGGLKATPYLSNVNKALGDLSYGLYIYSFVIQQTLMYFFKLDQITLFLYSLVLSVSFAYLSWHFVEKRALRLKDNLIKKSVKSNSLTNAVTS